MRRERIQKPKARRREPDAPVESLVVGAASRRRAVRLLDELDDVARRIDGLLAAR